MYKWYLQSKIIGEIWQDEAWDFSLIMVILYLFKCNFFEDQTRIIYRYEEIEK